MSASTSSSQPSTSLPAAPSALSQSLRERKRRDSSAPRPSFRSSLGGKAVGPKYHGGASSSRSIQTTGAASTANDSAFSTGSTTDGNEAGFLSESMMGSFSATREELRDGSARLASLSLLNPSPAQTPAISTGPTSSGFNFASPAPPVPASPSSPSGLSLARPGGGSGNTGSMIAVTTSSSDDDDLTPTGPSPSTSQGDDGTAGEESKITILGDQTGGDEESPEPREPIDKRAQEEEEGEREPRPPPSSSSKKNGKGVEIIQDPTERTPLIRRQGTSPSGSSATGSKPRSRSREGEEIAEQGQHAPHDVAAAVRSLWRGTRKRLGGVKDVDLKEYGQDAVSAIPAVILGTLMNILDGVSYGMIMFPTNLDLFSGFGGIGVSMFFVSCVVSQLVYTGGGSIFKGGNGSMMIEVVPFYHVIVNIISASASSTDSIVPTTMVAFAISSILTGLAFWALGAMKLGSLSEFFPRHILVGCIGGVGAFLFITGMQVSARLEESEGISLDALRVLFGIKIIPLWIVPLVLAIVLRLITHRYSHPLIFPCYFLAIPVVFYAIAFAARQSVDDLRKAGWVFEVGGVDSAWWEYWTLFNFKKTDIGALIDTIPTQVALVFFGLLHVPINVPALGISVGEDNVDTDRELVAHGISNVLAGLLGTVPNYLCYVNSVLFYKVGGTTRVSGFLLALASTGVLMAGPGVIGFLPVSVVGALIFILGLDLVKEAVWDTYGRVATFEYITIWCIIITMTVWDFVMGIGVGILLASLSFVVTSSRRRAVRTILSGSFARSTVRRHPKQSAFLKEVGKQIRIIKLQGFLFFGTISACERTIRKILDAAQWSQNPIRFLVLDFAMANGVDFSAAEAFVRIQRLLEDKGVVLIFCGCPADSAVGRALQSVDLWTNASTEEKDKVEVFENLNDALEHCENAFLRSLYSKDFGSPQIKPTVIGPGVTGIDLPKSELDSDVEIFATSPRAHHLRQAAKETIAYQPTYDPPTPSRKMNFQQPIPLLLQTLRPFAPDLNEDFCYRLSQYFTRVVVPRGESVWSVGSTPDSFYLIESGMLRAAYLFQDRSHEICESMVAGTVAGELSFLSRTRRNASVVAERESVLWRMKVEDHEEMAEKEGWRFNRKFEEALLRIATEEQEVLMGHLIANL